jgi:hypothetical protein
MIEIFLLIGWIDGNRAGGVIAQEFNSLETCKAAKTLYIQNHELAADSTGRYSGSWVECVKK